MPQSLTASNDNIAVDDKPTLEVISVELRLGDLDGAFTLGVGLTQSSGFTYALKLVLEEWPGNFQGKRLGVMCKKIMATLHMSVLQGS